MHTSAILWSGTLSLVGSVALLAQAPAPPRPAQRPSEARASVGTPVTATGCLKPWVNNAAAPNADAPPQQAPGGARFTLTDIESEKSESATSAETVPSEKTPEVRYLLLPSDTVDLAAHVNHRVKVVGTIAPPPSERASAAPGQPVKPSSAETNLPDKPKEAHPYDLVAVSSLTMVAASCSR